MQLKNENITGDMIEIMEICHKYVPRKTEQLSFHNETTGESEEYTEDYLHNILLGGDQLTYSRARSSQRARQNADSACDALLGLVPCCEDWHAKVTFLSVSNRSVCGGFILVKFTIIK